MSIRYADTHDTHPIRMILELSIRPNLIIIDTHYTHGYSLILTEQFADVKALDLKVRDGSA